MRSRLSIPFSLIILAACSVQGKKDANTENQSEQAAKLENQATATTKMLGASFNAVASLSDKTNDALGIKDAPGEARMLSNIAENSGPGELTEEDDKFVYDMRSNLDFNYSGVNTFLRYAGRVIKNSDGEKEYQIHDFSLVIKKDGKETSYLIHHSKSGDPSVFSVKIDLATIAEIYNELKKPEDGESSLKGQINIDGRNSNVKVVTEGLAWTHNETAVSISALSLSFNSSNGSIQDLDIQGSYKRRSDEGVLLVRFLETDKGRLIDVRAESR